MNSVRHTPKASHIEPTLTTVHCLKGSLFVIEKDRLRNGGPFMEGSFRVQGELGHIRAAVWKKPGKDHKSDGYLSLSLEVSKEHKYVGAMFRTNPREKTHASGPDYYGRLNLTKEKDGPSLRIAAWKQISAKGDQYLSLSIEAHKEKALIPSIRVQGADAYESFDREFID